AARERQALLEVLGILDLLVLGGLGDDPQVDQEGQNVVLLGGRVHLGEAGAEFLFGQRHVARADLHTVDLGQHRVVLGANRRGGGRQHSQAARHGQGSLRGGLQGGQAEAQAGFRFRERGGHAKSLSRRWGRERRRDTRPIMAPWQRERSVKRRNSLTSWRSGQAPGPAISLPERIRGDSAYFT